jgi:hypothetical protein
MDIDLYEFKETIKKFEEDEFIQFSEEKQVTIIEVGKTNKITDKKLLSLGYKIGEKVLVVIQ